MKQSRLLIITLMLFLFVGTHLSASYGQTNRNVPSKTELRTHQDASLQGHQDVVLNDSIRFSLLTCAAGGEAYSLFGHTAIRYENYTRGIDAVFNYGMFNFNAPNFILRFSLGETDYELGVTSFARFAAEYEYLGRDVWQQTLNLTQDEKERLVSLLEENYRPENRVYRYNFFFDNCATRVRDQIERAITAPLNPPKGGTPDESYKSYISYNESPPFGGIEGSHSFRSLLHQYTEGHPWVRYGIDLCLGSEADRPITPREMMFVPFCLQEAFQEATITNDTALSPRPLVPSSPLKIIETGKTPADFVTGGITPMQAALLLLAFTVAATIYGIRKGKTLWGFDLLLFSASGVVGCILTFLVLFSTHPAVSPNYLLLLYHPLHLLVLPWVIRKVRKRKLSYYMMAKCAVLIIFIGLWPLMPQKFPLTTLPLALCLLVRGASNIYLSKKATRRRGDKAQNLVTYKQ